MCVLAVFGNLSIKALYKVHSYLQHAGMLEKSHWRWRYGAVLLGDDKGKVQITCLIPMIHILELPAFPCKVSAVKKPSGLCVCVSVCVMVCMCIDAVCSGCYPVFKAGEASLGNQLLMVEVYKSAVESPEPPSDAENLNTALEILVRVIRFSSFAYVSAFIHMK